MTSMPPDALLPVLVADLADDEAREVLDAAAFTGGRVWVPLETAPVSAAQHVLEVHTPGFEEPFYYIAEPLGPPTEHGFPLRISAMPDAPDARPARATRDFVVGRNATQLNLSESHTKDLSHVGPLPTEETEGGLVGRSIAGGKLLIEQLIGRGGVGAVYRARHRELMMAVAVKVLHESFQSDIDFARRFYAEALAASRLDHLNITRVIDFGQEPDGQLYFAMEFLDGEELRALLEKEGRLPATRVASLMMQVCAGLSHAHARGIVHRDIKPENLVLVPSHDDDGNQTEVVKVCDFGIALHRALPEEEEGTVAGTPEYMSPEQCRGDDLDARSDVYACGIVLYEMATGQTPFTADSAAKILNKHQFTPPLAPSRLVPSVDPHLERIIMKAIAKDAGDRQQSMRELRSELRDLLDVDHAPVASGRELPSSEELAVPSSPMPPPSQPMPTLPEDTGEYARARVERVDEAPAWLERGSGATYTSQARPEGDLSANTIAWAQRLAKTPDPKAFAAASQKLEPALRALAQRGDMHALWTVSSTMHGIAAEGSGSVGSRAWSASKLLKVFDDPAILMQIGEQLLAAAQPEMRDKARRLLIHAGVAGAYGVYGARVKHAKTPAVRGQFVTVLKDFGPRAWPVVRASLEKISTTEAPNPATFELAEDLLLSVPFVGDEQAGHLVMKFLRWSHSPVCRAATAAIVRLWGDRAKPLLVAMVQSKDDIIRIAGIAGLKQLNSIDEHLVPRLHAILTRRVPAGEEVRAAAAVALANAVPSARQPAVTLLAQMLTPQRDAGLPDPRMQTGALSKQDAVVIAMARSLLTLSGKTYRGLVAERAERSSEPLRGQLRGLLASA